MSRAKWKDTYAHRMRSTISALFSHVRNASLHVPSHIDIDSILHTNEVETSAIIIEFCVYSVFLNCVTLFRWLHSITEKPKHGVDDDDDDNDSGDAGDGKHT